MEPTGKPCLRTLKIDNLQAIRLPSPPWTFFPGGGALNVRAIRSEKKKIVESAKQYFVAREIGSIARWFPWDRE